jgi:hypothetical protein
MKDELEDFIGKNRKAFDDQEPSEKVWSIIERSLGFQRHASLWNSVALWRAAAVIFMAVTAFLLLPKDQSAKQQLALKEFSDVENFYIQQISEKTDMIEEFKRSDGLNGFTNDFRQLEAMYLVLKDEMKNHPSQKVKDALVLNLLVRIDLLNQQIHRLENQEYKEPDGAENPPAKNV